MTAMSRKFYQALAARYKAEKPSVHAQSYPMWVQMVFATTSTIAEGNPAFDKQRFLLSCGVEADVEQSGYVP